MKSIQTPREAYHTGSLSHYSALGRLSWWRTEVHYKTQRNLYMSSASKSIVTFSKAMLSTNTDVGCRRSINSSNLASPSIAAIWSPKACSARLTRTKFRLILHLYASWLASVRDVLTRMNTGPKIFIAQTTGQTTKQP